jgi:hypothetical protein
MTSPFATVEPLRTMRVSVILNVGPVTCGTETRVDRTASSVPVHLMVCDRAPLLPESGVARGDGVARVSTAGALELEQAATVIPQTATPQRATHGTRMLVAILDSLLRDLGCRWRQ